MGGVKVGRSRISLPLRVEVERLCPPQDFLVSLEQHLLLVYTGKTRLARNLLQVGLLLVCAELGGGPDLGPLTHGVSMMMMMMMCLQDVVRSWYSRLPLMVQNAQELVANSEECSRACSEGQRLQ